MKRKEIDEPIWEVNHDEVEERPPRREAESRVVRFDELLPRNEDEELVRDGYVEDLELAIDEGRSGFGVEQAYLRRLRSMRRGE